MKRIVPVVMVVTVIFAVGMLLAPAMVSAASGPKAVAGYVWDNAGNNITGASITVNIRNLTNVIKATQSDTTDSDGYYAVTFQPADWEIGYTIETISTYNSIQETNSTTATNYPFQFVNISYPFEIPELGSWVGLVIAGGFLGAVAVVMLTRRKN